jgi:DNA polymerase-1
MNDTATSPKPLLVLLDGAALAYRAYHALLRSNMSAPDGKPVAAVFGVASEIQRLLSALTPTHAALVFDTPHPTFRHERYPQYKAHRSPMPDALAEQLPRIKEAAQAMGFPLVEMPGFEADDLIGTLAREAEVAGMDTVILTPDKDMLQLVTERTTVWRPARQGEEPVRLDPKGVLAFFGVPPSGVVDVLALMGDTSDNIPGVSGIGEKGAVRLIQNSGSLQALLDSPPADLSPKVRQALVTERSAAELSRELATIARDAPLPRSLESLAFHVDAAAAASFFSSLGFRTLSQHYAAKSTSASAPLASATQWTIVRDLATLEALLVELANAELYSVDTETTGLNTRSVDIVGMSFATAPGRAFYVPLNLDPPLLPDLPGTRQGSAVLERFRAVLEDPRPRKCGQNAKYDLLVFRHHGIRLRGLRLDTMVASYLIEPEQRERNLDALTLRHFQHVKIKTSTLIGDGASLMTMAQAPVEEVGRYACEDADFTLRLALKFEPLLRTQPLQQLHEDMELPLVQVLADIEDFGIRVERQVLDDLQVELRREVKAFEGRIHALAGEAFNCNSPRQLGAILFDKLKVHELAGIKPKKTTTGYATHQEVLESLGDVHELPRLVLEYRSLAKLLGTYVETLPALVQEDGRIHASFHQTVAITGRLSSSDPNLQNIPIRSATGRRIREAFIPTDKDGVLISADYSQVELRILAHMSGDEALATAFKAGLDIHRDTAARIFGLAPDAVDSVQRSRAKAINFGILYGMGARRLARETGLSLKEAQDFIQRYFAVFPAVRGFIEGLKASARNRGYAETLLGRRRPLPELAGSDPMLRAFAENMAVNTPIQGTAADILKLAMIRLHRALESGGWRSRMVLTVHDELVLDAPADEAERVAELTRSEMQAAFPLSVPLVVEVGRGASWASAH